MQKFSTRLDVVCCSNRNCIRCRNTFVNLIVREHHYLLSLHFPFAVTEYRITVPSSNIQITVPLHICCCYLHEAHLQSLSVNQLDCLNICSPKASRKRKNKQRNEIADCYAYVGVFTRSLSLCLALDQAHSELSNCGNYNFGHPEFGYSCALKV